MTLGVKRRKNPFSFIDTLGGSGRLVMLIMLFVGAYVSNKHFIKEPKIHYSDGERFGVLRKFSEKGIFYKTYEGELMLNANMGSVKLDTFKFSVNDSGVANGLKGFLGKEIKVHYNQYLFVPYRVGSTQYLVDKFELNIKKL